MLKAVLLSFLLSLACAHEQQAEYTAPSLEEFVLSHYAPSVGTMRKLLSSNDAPDPAEKEREREETIGKLRVYLIGGVLIGLSVYVLQSAIHNPNNRSSIVEGLRRNFLFRKCCFAYKPAADYSRVQEDTDPENASLTGTAGEQKSPPPPKDDEPEFNVGVLAGCVIGLLVSYLTWGFFQEMLMTQEYPNTAGGSDRFKEAEFLVFLNRLSGLIISSVAVSRSNLTHFAPPYMFLFCSMSNIMSAWFQYEALKFITFPMQVLAKSCKVLFTMLMGVAVNNKSFSCMEYINALCIALGLAVFKFGQDSGPPTDDSVNAKYFTVGLTLIAGYICSDSFTSNWQSRIFRMHKISPLQMMQGVNIFSASFSLLSCAPQMGETMSFFATHPKIVFHASLMSLCSGSGQLFIFYTIKRFGAVVFAVAMTTRLILSVLLSIVMFSHPINGMAFFGMFITFCSLIGRVWMKKQAASKKKASSARSSKR